MGSALPPLPQNGSRARGPSALRRPRAGRRRRLSARPQASARRPAQARHDSGWLRARQPRPGSCRSPAAAAAGSPPARGAGREGDAPTRPGQAPPAPLRRLPPPPSPACARPAPPSRRRARPALARAPPAPALGVRRRPISARPRELPPSPHPPPPRHPRAAPLTPPVRAATPGYPHSVLPPPGVPRRARSPLRTGHIGSASRTWRHTRPRYPHLKRCWGHRASRRDGAGRGGQAVPHLRAPVPPPAAALPPFRFPSRSAAGPVGRPRACERPQNGVARPCAPAGHPAAAAQRHGQPAPPRSRSRSQRAAIGAGVAGRRPPPPGSGYPLPLSAGPGAPAALPPPPTRGPGRRPPRGPLCRAVLLPSLAEPRPPGSGARAPAAWRVLAGAPPLPDSQRRAPALSPSAERRAAGPAPARSARPGRHRRPPPPPRPAGGPAAAAAPSLPPDGGRGLRRQPRGSGRRATPPPHRHGWAGTGRGRPGGGQRSGQRRDVAPGRCCPGCAGGRAGPGCPPGCRAGSWVPPRGSAARCAARADPLPPPAAALCSPPPPRSSRAGAPDRAATAFPTPGRGPDQPLCTLRAAAPAARHSLPGRVLPSAPKTPFCSGRRLAPQRACGIRPVGIPVPCLRLDRTRWQLLQRLPASPSGPALPAAGHGAAILHQHVPQRGYTKVRNPIVSPLCAATRQTLPCSVPEHGVM
ncbi:basic proline-rich protein-like [Lathamus discolor]|uniref:basic proline-rich protein-like n=1 Tax=Lathamus discolor TaxID=678569 RepID=UPI0032B6FFC1